MSFSEILSQCRNPLDNARKEAENLLDQLATENFGKLLYDCAKEISNESSLKENRQLCATIIKNMILYQPKHEGKWEQLNKEIKDEIKTNVLSSLASDQKEVRKASAMTVAEIPRGDWPEIIGILISTAGNENINYRLSSIITIGYIAQELSLGQLTTNEVDQILSALISNLNDKTLSPEVLAPTIESFLNFLTFAGKNMELRNEREIIFQTIFNCLQHNNVMIQVYSMQCLVEISRIYYDYLEYHLNDIIGVIIPHMTNSDEKVAIQGYEFWCSVSDEEIARISNPSSKLPFKKYCTTAIEILFNTIKFHLLNRNIQREQQSEEEWDTVKAASCLLDNLSRCTDDYVVDGVFSMISEYLDSDQYKIRDSVMLAFGSILETRCKGKVKNIIAGAIPKLTGMLQDKSVEVRNTVAWCIKKICELHTDCLGEPNTFNTVMNAIIENLNGHKKVVLSLCESIHYLAFYFRNPYESSGFLSPHVTTLLNTLLQIAFQPDAYDPNCNIALAAFYALGSVIENAPLDTNAYIGAFFKHIYDAFLSTLNIENFRNEEMQKAYQGYIATVISSCTAGEKIKMQPDQAVAVYSLLKESFIKRRNVYEEGLMACSSLALTIGQDFAAILPDFYEYLKYALSQWQDASICRIAINSASDLIRALGNRMNEYIPILTPYILSLLKNECDKSLKTQAFIVITDMFCHTREEALKYYGEIMDLVKNALEAALFIVDKNEDSDLFEYFKNLREHLLECLTCVIHCLQDINRTDMFSPYAGAVIEFVQRVVGSKYEPTWEILAGSLGVLGDMCEMYQQRMKGSIHPETCTFIIEQLKKHPTKKYSPLCEWAAQVIYESIVNAS